jgi:hypothetical protein
LLFPEPAEHPVNAVIAIAAQRIVPRIFFAFIEKFLLLNNVALPATYNLTLGI